MGYRISAQLAEFVANTPATDGLQKRAMLHAQSGISSDIGTTPARVCRTAMSQIDYPSANCRPTSRLYYYSGISDILTLYETIKRNLRHWYKFALGAFRAVMR
ncbi:glycyl radical enzyme domain-containing protein [Shigella boydii]